MTDGNTQAIAKYLDERDEWDALQEVTVDLEQAEARIEELEEQRNFTQGLVLKLDAKLAKAVNFIEDLTGSEWPYNEQAKRTLAELRGEQ